ncbi:winged helix-turn-helix domain-containing protein [Amycolatopsis mediterranei]|uniref:GntR family transcriptional regulator n=1 Tax=Amycolatopsis mediterranei TaxID=33910 RepID=UPI00341320B0
MEQLEQIDPDDPRPPFQQVVAVLRAAILTRKFEPGDQLPSYAELAKHFDVAPMTAQKAVGLLRNEGLVVTRQGRGSFVRQRTERAVGLRPHIDQMFQAGDVAIDFAGFSGETLHGALSEPLDKVRAGLLHPSSLRIRILLPDLTQPIGLPALAADRSDSPAVRARSRRITHRSIQGIVETVEELSALGVIEAATAQVRVFHAAPLFKLYILNESEAFFGFYPVVEHSVAIEGKPVDIFDPMGKDAVLFHYSSTDDETSISSQYVEQSQKWFNSVWDSVAREYSGGE